MSLLHGAQIVSVGTLPGMVAQDGLACWNWRRFYANAAPYLAPFTPL